MLKHINPQLLGEEHLLLKKNNMLRLTMSLLELLEKLTKKNFYKILDVKILINFLKLKHGKIISSMSEGRTQALSLQII